MEQSTPSCSSSSPLTEDEFLVSKILLNLKALMSLAESLPDLNWSRRRKRSCLLTPPPPPLNSASSMPSAPPEDKIEEERISPDTPLSFPHAESDDVKPKHSPKKKKFSLKRSRDMVETLTKRKELLSGEIRNVKKHYSKLKAINSQLKSMKQEALRSGLRRGDSEMEITDPTAKIAADSQPSDCVTRSVNGGGPLDFDLNLPAEEAFGDVEAYQPLDAAANERLRSAEARRNRMRIMKNKLIKNGI